MASYTVAEAKNRLPALLRAAERGERAVARVLAKGELKTLLI